MITSLYVTGFSCLHYKYGHMFCYFALAVETCLIVILLFRNRVTMWPPFVSM
ncbi:hypothetical protein Bca4012_066849 [Brassica carinata]